MAIRKNNKGYTMVSMLATISILFISLPFITYLLNSLSYPSQYSVISTNQFFLFLRDELIASPQLEVNKQAITYQDNKGDDVTISLYQDLIRRQVKGKGHEIFLRDVEYLTFKKLTHGLRVSIKTTQGEKYEKILFIY